MPMGYMSSGRGEAPQRLSEVFQRYAEWRGITCPFFGMQRQPDERPRSDGQVSKKLRVRDVRKPLVSAVLSKIIIPVVVVSSNTDAGA